MRATLVLHCVAQLAHDPLRSQTSVASVSMLCCVRFHAVRSGFGTKIFEQNLRPQNFALEIARDRAKIHAAWWCAACFYDRMRSLTTVPSISMLRRVRLRAISDRKFRNFFAAAKFCVENRVRSRRNSCRFVVHSSLTVFRGHEHLCRASTYCGTRD